MVQNLIAAHPQVVPLYEPVGLWLFADPTRRDDEFTASDATIRVKDFIRREFLKFQKANGNRIIVEKTPHNILRIPYVREIFPEAHYLYIVRNPLSFVSSVELKWRQPATKKRLYKRLKSTPMTQLHHYFGRFLSQQWNKRVLGRQYVPIWGPRYKGIEDDLKSQDLLTIIARQWARASKKAEADLSLFESGRVLKLSYEDFVERPSEHMQQICAHCALEMTKEMDETVRAVVKRDRSQKWQRLSPDALAKILPELSPEMTRHGYKIPAEIRRDSAAIVSERAVPASA